MGVAGSGKSTVGASLASRLGARFVDADSLHPPHNVAKMSAGIPLDDADRGPWLAAVRDALAADGSVVVACSALRREYRDVLRGVGDVRFVFLDLDESSARRRAAEREGHFMSAAMVASQFETLERPGPDEPDVVTVDANRVQEAVLDDIGRFVPGANRPVKPGRVHPGGSTDPSGSSHRRAVRR